MCQTAKGASTSHADVRFQRLFAHILFWGRRLHTTPLQSPLLSSTHPCGNPLVGALTQIHVVVGVYGIEVVAMPRRSQQLPGSVSGDRGGGRTERCRVGPEGEWQTLPPYTDVPTRHQIESEAPIKLQVWMKMTSSYAQSIRVQELSCHEIDRNVLGAE